MTSSVTSKVVSDFDGLDNLIRNAKGSPFAKVGVLAGTNSRTSDEDSTNEDNASIGMKHEFGSASERIPPRSFLRMPLSTHSRELMKAAAGGEDMLDEMIGKIGMEGAAARLGIAGENIVQDAFQTRGFGQWAPNAPRTIASKGSDSPLIATSQLRRAITSEVVT